MREKDVAFVGVSHFRFEMRCSRFCLLMDQSIATPITKCAILWGMDEGLVVAFRGGQRFSGIVKILELRHVGNGDRPLRRSHKNRKKKCLS